MRLCTSVRHAFAHLNSALQRLHELLLRERLQAAVHDRLVQLRLRLDVLRPDSYISRNSAARLNTMGGVHTFSPGCLNMTQHQGLLVVQALLTTANE